MLNVYRRTAVAAQALASPVLGQVLGPVAHRSRGGKFAAVYRMYSSPTLTNISGTTADHCNTGCQANYGQCKTPTTAPAMKVSEDGRCGPQHGGQTCAGSRFGNCCSQYR